jgi:hypothetical protein
MEEKCQNREYQTIYRLIEASEAPIIVEHQGAWPFMICGKTFFYIFPKIIIQAFTLITNLNSNEHIRVDYELNKI